MRHLRRKLKAIKQSVHYRVNSARYKVIIKLYADGTAADRVCFENSFFCQPRKTYYREDVYINPSAAKPPELIFGKHRAAKCACGNRR